MTETTTSTITPASHVPHQIPLVAPENMLPKVKAVEKPTLDIASMTEQEKEKKIVDTLDRFELKYAISYLAICICLFIYFLILN